MLAEKLVRRHSFIAIAIFSISSGCSRTDQQLPKGALAVNPIIGNWQVISGEVFGKKIEGKEAWGMWITFGPDKAIWHFNTTEGEKSFDGYYHIDASKVPYEIDLRQPNSDDPNRTTHGIYQIEGDTLRISMGADRPKDLTAPTDSKLVFKRVKGRLGPVK